MWCHIEFMFKNVDKIYQPSILYYDELQMRKGVRFFSGPDLLSSGPGWLMKECNKAKVGKE